MDHEFEALIACFTMLRAIEKEAKKEDESVLSILYSDQPLSDELIDRNFESHKDLWKRRDQFGNALLHFFTNSR